MEWNFRNGVPIYSQIVDELTMRIASHAYEPGDKLPSVRDLALDAGVNPNTMQRALAELERQGLVYTERTSGRFVTRDETVLKQLRAKLAHGYMRDLMEKLGKIGMNQEEISELMHNYQEEQ